MNEAGSAAARATSPERGSEALRRVVDALLEGAPAPPDAQAALTDAERAEVASLARTAHLARVTLRRPDPPPAVQSAAWARAEQALASRTPFPARAEASDGERAPFWQTWWRRLSGSSDADGSAREDSSTDA